MLIGDNVASHLSVSVIKSCLENGIKFAFLPPNATHLCQPLDVAYFRPLKKSWKVTLEEWKKHSKGCVPKHKFPQLLKNALNAIESTCAQNMRAGFRASGMFPLDRHQVLKRIPSAEIEQRPAAENSFAKQLVELLQNERFGKQTDRSIPKRRRLVDIKPGASVSEEQANQLKSIADDKTTVLSEIQKKRVGGSGNTSVLKQVRQKRVNLPGVSGKIKDHEDEGESQIFSEIQNKRGSGKTSVPKQVKQVRQKLVGQVGILTAQQDGQKMNVGDSGKMKNHKEEGESTVTKRVSKKRVGKPGTSSVSQYKKKRIRS